MTSLPFRAVIVDDEPLAIEGMRRLCAASGLVSIIGEAHDGPSALALIGDLTPQAVFLDIAMPGMTGLAVAASLKRLAPASHIVLVTAHDHFATEAFDLAVVDYILKPIEPDRLTRAIERVASLVTRQPSDSNDSTSLWVPFRGTLFRLPIRDIRRIEAERDYVRIYDDERHYLMRATLADLADRLTDHFVRIHRSTVIACARVVGIRHVARGSWNAVEVDGTEFPIGRTYLAGLRAALQIGNPIP